MAPRRILRALIFDYVATHSGWLKSTDLRQKGACNQGKKDIWEQIPRSRGQLRPSVTTGENQGLRGETPYKAQSTLCVCLLNFLFLFCSVTASPRTSPHRHRQKKSPRNRLFSTFLCRTLKRICVSVVWQEQIKTSSRYDGCKAKVFTQCQDMI